MGDSPSVGYLLHGTPPDPRGPGGEGSSCGCGTDARPCLRATTTAADAAEAFGVVEFALPVPAGMPAGQAARMIVDGRIPAAGARDGDALRFRFSPRDAKVWPYVIRSDNAGLDGVSGQFTAAHAFRRTGPAGRLARILIGGPTTPIPRPPKACMPARSMSADGGRRFCAISPRAWTGPHIPHRDERCAAGDIPRCHQLFIFAPVASDCIR